MVSDDEFEAGNPP